MLRPYRPSADVARISGVNLSLGVYNTVDACLTDAGHAFLAFYCHNRPTGTLVSGYIDAPSIDLIRDFGHKLVEKADELDRLIAARAAEIAAEAIAEATASERSDWA